jgi:uncharacterized RDD family membrane protein YckC
MGVGIDSQGISFGYASRVTRLFGQFIDGLIGGAPIFVGAFLLAASPSLGLIVMIAAFAWAFFYVFFADGLEGGQSLAKRWLGIRVVSAETGKPCTFGQSFLRNFLLTILGPIDWIFIFGERHQRLGDKAAGTVVIDAD